MTAHSLRVEHLDHPLGILTRTPRLSWKLPSGYQVAYQLRTDNGWDTGRVDSPTSLLVPYGGPPLGSAQRVTWQVKVWTDHGECDWSVPAWFETGRFDWTAQWVTGEGLVRGVFHSGRSGPARLSITAHGLYEAFLNGVRVGDAELTPGFTQYRSRLQVQTYEVSLSEGPNVLGVILTDGWYRGQVGALHKPAQWGTSLALLAQIDELTATSWRTAPGHILAADLIAGERVDRRQLPVGWTSPGFDDSHWSPAVFSDFGYVTLVDSPAPPVRRVEELAPVAITRPAPDRQVIDLGQNINGWIRLRRLGPAGTRIVLTHGEHVSAHGDARGDVTTDHLKPDFPFLPAPLPAGMVDEVISAGRPDDVFEPRHTTHGFRYVRVEGLDEPLTADDVRGIVVHTDLRRTGWFTCSDPRLNALHEAAVWSLRDNVCDIPTDCPQRERAGWTGDWQLFVPTAAFLFDVAGFSVKWLRDVQADQWADGTVANMSPCPPAEGEGSPMAALNGSAGWGDAVVIVPWTLFQVYGDEHVLAELWPAMTAWLARAERLSTDGLWHSGFHWGEWLEPGEFTLDMTADQSHVATAYLSYSAGLMASIARVLGVDSSHFSDLSARARAAWQHSFVSEAGRLNPDTQATYVRALAFELVPESLRQAMADRLVELIRAAGTHLGTGFLATPYLLPVLADAGRLDVAYELLFRDTEPSWLTMIDRGATTMWERWNGVDADGVAHESLNHYAKGAVISFLHRYVAGLSPVEPAYRRFRVRPRPGGGVTWAQATHDSPYGRIEVSWRLVGDRFDLHLTVPPGTTADVTWPDGTARTLGPGRYRF